MLGSPPGASLADVLGRSALDRIALALQADDLFIENPLPLDVRETPFEGTIHRQGDAVILELEPVPRNLPPIDRLLRDAVTRIQRARSVDALCTTAAEQIRALTGFDRVMVYRFHSDGHGEVVAEARAADVDPFLGHHFPASDIPRQARQLYLLNAIRVIPDARYQAVPLVAVGDATEPLDLTFASLRAVSPVHLEYLANMGVLASMSVSLTRGNTLWGLLACHHRAARHVPFVVRSACEVVGKLASLQMDALEEKATQTQRDALRGGESVLVRSMRGASEGWGTALLSRADALLRLVQATGAAVVDENGVRTVGDVPAIAEMAHVVAWLASTRRTVFATASLGRDHPPAEVYRSVASGLLAVRVPSPNDAYILWFRQELLRTVTWGGDPSKPAASIPNSNRLHPRTSFAAWKELVRGSSAPWTVAELDIAEDMARRAVESDLEQQIDRAEKAVRARDDLLAIVSHDLKNPLNVIEMASAQARKQVSDGAPLAAFDRIDRAARRMNVLIANLLDTAKIESGRFQVHTARCDARTLVDDAVALHAGVAEHKQVRLETSVDDVEVIADRDRMFQVIGNLLGNALKLVARGGNVAISVHPLDGFARFDIQDDGPGIDPGVVSHVFERFWQAPNSTSRGGSGLGLYIAKGLVEAHGGRLWVARTSDAGTTFAFTVPLAQAESASDADHSGVGA